MPQLLMLLKGLVLNQATRALGKVLFRTMAKRQLARLIRKAEDKGFTRGIDIDEDRLSAFFLLLIEGGAIPQEDQEAFANVVNQLIFNEPIRGPI